MLGLIVLCVFVCVSEERFSRFDSYTIAAAIERGVCNNIIRRGKYFFYIKKVMWLNNMVLLLKMEN